jgi:hypothetical protein
MAYDPRKTARDALGRFAAKGRKVTKGVRVHKGLGKVRAGSRQTNVKASGGPIAGVPSSKANKKPKIGTNEDT